MQGDPQSFSTIDTEKIVIAPAFIMIRFTASPRSNTRIDDGTTLRAKAYGHV